MLIHLFVFSPLSSLFFPIFNIFESPIAIITINGSKAITPAIMHSTATVGLVAASSIAGLAYAKPATESNNIAISVGQLLVM